MKEVLFTTPEVTLEYIKFVWRKHPHNKEECYYITINENSTILELEYHVLENEFILYSDNSERPYVSTLNIKSNLDLHKFIELITYKEPTVVIEEPMDIFSSNGTKVVYTGKNGYDSDKEYANRYLTIGEIYTVYYTNVESWSSTVVLKEYPDQSFNTAHFNQHKDETV